MKARLTVILTDASIVTLVRAIEENLWEFHTTLRWWPEAKIHDQPEYQCLLTGAAFPMFNVVQRARLPAKGADAAIDEVMARCREHRTPVLWFVGPTTQPADLAARLERHGFRSSPGPGMSLRLSTVNLSQPRPAGLTIERVVDDVGLSAWARVLVDAFAAPAVAVDGYMTLYLAAGLEGEVPLRHYLARMDGIPVGTATLLLAAGVAGIYYVATTPEARHQGAAAALVLRLLHEARAQGYQIATVHAFKSGVSLYRRLGFRECCTIDYCIWDEQGGWQIPG